MSMRDSGVDSSLSLSGSTKYADGSAIGPKDRPRTADDFPYGRIRHCSGVPWDDHHMARHLDRSTAIHGMPRFVRRSRLPRIVQQVQGITCRA